MHPQNQCDHYVYSCHCFPFLFWPVGPCYLSEPPIGSDASLVPVLSVGRIQIASGVSRWRTCGNGALQASSRQWLRLGFADTEPGRHGHTQERGAASRCSRDGLRCACLLLPRFFDTLSRLDLRLAFLCFIVHVDLLLGFGEPPLSTDLLVGRKGYLDDFTVATELIAVAAILRLG